MRDCIFLLADKNMEATFIGFLTRDGFHFSLGIHQFDFDPQQDIINGLLLNPVQDKDFIPLGG